ncbi:hypothetical protein SGR_3574 [Streptomyces griseus subsp. griseus NBRC 13350]|uniref:Uncharacterized protein n=1 Tax=Streptomyces griseus subsp. griseus (strain JCM 4626 / CBS 651.72 / NBRC 13350 / KCC S-0626 / ISP 5235) TaxID=455632 RepID=B1VP24_STRGG|nr:hypothetical protein SGR_3574 [Streptomyces griseus subsp. griseus NBRC 13350]
MCKGRLTWSRYRDCCTAAALPRRLGDPPVPAAHPAVDHPEADQHEHRSTDGPTQGAPIAVLQNAGRKNKDRNGQTHPVEGPVESLEHRRLIHSSILADARALHQPRAHHVSGGSSPVHAPSSPERRRPHDSSDTTAHEPRPTPHPVSPIPYAPLDLLSNWSHRSRG